MSFMFKPYPFTDPVPVNHIQLPPELRQSPVSGNAATAAKLLAHAPRVLLLDGYVAADFSGLIQNLREQLPGKKIELVKFSDAYRSSEELEKFLTDFLPEDRVSDPILLFGKSHPVTIDALIDPAKLDAVIRKAVNSKKTTIVEAIVEPRANVYPMQPGGQPVEGMIYS